MQKIDIYKRGKMVTGLIAGGTDKNCETKQILENIGNYERTVGGAQASNHSRKSYLEFLKDPKKHFARAAVEQSAAGQQQQQQHKNNNFYGDLISKNSEHPATEASGTPAEDPFIFIKVTDKSKQQIPGEQNPKDSLRRIPTGMSDFKSAKSVLASSSSSDEDDKEFDIPAPFRRTRVKKMEDQNVVLARM